MPKYNVGDFAWIAQVVSENSYVPCPVCYGNKTVILILGNGDQVEIDCTFCRNQFYQASGQVVAHRYHVATVTLERITGVEERTTPDGLETKYWFSYYGYSSWQIHETEEQAREEGKKRAIEYDLHDEQERAKAAKFNINKSYTWNAGYYMQLAERSKKDMEHALGKAKVMRKKAGIE